MKIRRSALGDFVFSSNTQQTSPRGAQTAEVPNQSRMTQALNRLKKSSSVVQSGAPEDQRGCFQIDTNPDSAFGSRTFVMAVATESELDEWIAAVEAAHGAVMAELDKQRSPLYILRNKLSRGYDHSSVQVAFACVIALNFLCNVTEKAVLPEDGTAAKRVFVVLDIIFTSVFTFELLWNMSANLVARFIFDLWNIFDTFVVVTSILSLIPTLNLPGVSVLRLLRVFRAVRLFRKLASLRVLFNALLKSLAPVTSSLIILFMITSMYGILAVSLFGHRSPDFRNFHEAVFSMWQVATGDSWGGVLARSLFYVCVDIKSREMFGSPLPPPDLGFTPGGEGACGEGREAVFDQTVLIFFTSYSVISLLVLLNVVIAVFLDNFIRCVGDEERNLVAEKAAASGVEEQRSHEFILDPIISEIAEFEGLEHLQAKLLANWNRLNPDDIAEIDFETMQESLRTWG